MLKFFRGVYRLNINNLPESPVFGKYDKAAGKYTMNNVLGIEGSVYEINVAFENDILTSLSTSVTMPTESWARSLKESLSDEISSINEIYGQNAEISCVGNKITVNADVSEEVSREYVEKYIIAIDILMNRPFLADIF